MKKKVAFVYGGLIRYVYILRIRYVKDKMRSLMARALCGPRELFESHELIYAPCYLIYWVGCIIYELPGRILNRFQKSLLGWMYYKKYRSIKI